ncbi:MAG: hypothetical protein GF355_13385 [Candidatus Eisenbacteria bacterium]|nr:hypothetical protein [Candidatus Eisenbacteria bacterium]
MLRIRRGESGRHRGAPFISRSAAIRRAPGEALCRPARTSLLLLLPFLLAAGCRSGPSGGEPAEDRPPGDAAPSPDSALAVSPSGHYFTYRGETRFLIHESGTQCVLQNLNVDYRGWVETLAAEGHAGAHIWAFVAPRQQLDGSVIEPRYGYVYPGAVPWARRPGGPSAHDGGRRYDLQTFDEGTDPGAHYWPRLRDLCRRLQKRGMILGITVFFGWPKDDEDFRYHPFARENGGPAAERADITHIADPGIEIHAQAWDSRWPARRRSQWLWERFCLKLIAETAAFDNVWFDFRDEWSYAEDTNMEAHFRRFFMSRGCLWADRSAAADIRVTNPETPSFGPAPAVRTEGGPYHAFGVLDEVWRQALAGVHYLLHADSREPGIPAWDPVAAEQRGLDPHDDRGRRFVGLAARFFHRHVRNLDHLEPFPELASGGHCLADPGREYVVHIHQGHRPVIDLTHLAGQASVSFYDVQTGELQSPLKLTGGGTVMLPPPDTDGPWVAWITADEP